MHHDRHCDRLLASDWLSVPGYMQCDLEFLFLGYTNFQLMHFFISINLAWYINTEYLGRALLFFS